MQLPGEFSPFIEKKVVFCLVVGGVTHPPLLVVRPLKKPLFFMCVFPNYVMFFFFLSICEIILFSAFSIYRMVNFILIIYISFTSESEKNNPIV